MLYAHSLQETKFDYFASFLKNVIKGDNRYINVITPLINDARMLALGEKDYFQIDRNSFDVIVHLAEKDPNFLRHINIEHLSPQDYEHILNLVTSQRDLIVV